MAPALKDAPGVHKPQQKRSERAQQSILEGLERLLQKREYTDISVSDIAREAGCALGGVYNRFTSKDHMLLALAEKITIERIDPRYENQKNPGWSNDLSVQAFLEIYLAIIAMPLVEYRHIFRPLAMVSRIRGNDDFSQFLKRREEKSQAHKTRVIFKLAKAENPDTSEEAVRLAVYWMHSLFREYVLFGDKVLTLAGVKDDRYFTELSHLISRYLMSPSAGLSLTTQTDNAAS